MPRQQSEPDRFFLYSPRRGFHQVIDRFGGYTVASSSRKRDAERECRNWNRRAREDGTLRGGEPRNIVEQYDPATVFLRQKVTVLRRISAELRGFFAPEVRQDPEVQAILRDCDTLDQIALELSSPAVTLTSLGSGIPANGTRGVGTAARE